MIDQDLHYTVMFKSKDGTNEYAGTVIAWQDYMAQVKWPRRTVTTLTKGFVTKDVVKEPEITWINPVNPGFTLIEPDNIYNRAVKSIKAGITPGQVKTVWESGSIKIVIARAKSQERINLSLRNNPSAKPLQIAHWGKDDSRQSGGGKWIFTPFQEYLQWASSKK